MDMGKKWMGFVEKQVQLKYKIVSFQFFSYKKCRDFGGGTVDG